MTSRCHRSRSRIRTCVILVQSQGWIPATIREWSVAQESNLSSPRAGGLQPPVCPSTLRLGWPTGTEPVPAKSQSAALPVELRPQWSDWDLNPALVACKASVRSQAPAPCAPPVGLEPTLSGLGGQSPLHRRGYRVPTGTRTRTFWLEARGACPLTPQAHSSRPGTRTLTPGGTSF